MIDLAPIRALLDIHMGRGASKAALHAHILAYEHLVPALLSELAAAQPVVEWEDIPSGFWAEKGDFTFAVLPGGWWLDVADHNGDIHTVDRGPETGPAGKAACEAVYRRACGLPAPIAPQVVRLHQAYEGATACLHCGKPQPWPEMDRCPRDSGIPAIPACAG